MAFSPIPLELYWVFTGFLPGFYRVFTGFDLHFHESRLERVVRGLGILGALP